MLTKLTAIQVKSSIFSSILSICLKELLSTTWHMYDGTSQQVLDTISVLMMMNELAMLNFGIKIFIAKVGIA
jgi:hypothetical protein